VQIICGRSGSRKWQAALDLALYRGSDP